MRWEIVASMPYQQRSGSLLYSIHAQLCQRAKGNSVPILSFWIAMLCYCVSVGKRQSFMRPQHSYGYREWRLADRNIIGLRNLHVDLNSAYVSVALHFKDLFVIHAAGWDSASCLDRRARARSKSCGKNSFHTCDGHPFFCFAHITAVPVSYLRSFT